MEEIAVVNNKDGQSNPECTFDIDENFVAKLLFGYWVFGKRFFFEKGSGLIINSFHYPCNWHCCKYVI